MITAAISFESIERQHVFDRIRRAAKTAVRDVLPGTIKFDLYEWIVNYCQDPYADEFLVAAPNFTLSLASMMQLHNRVTLTKRSFVGRRYQMAVWHMVIKEVLGGEVPSDDIKRFTKPLNELNEALAYLFSTFDGPAKTEDPNAPAGRISLTIRPGIRARTIDRDAVVPPKRKAHADTIVTVIKPQARRRKKLKPRDQPAEGSAAKTEGDVITTGLTSTVATSAAFASTDQEYFNEAVPICTNMPDPPSDWQMNADDDALVLYQNVCIPSVCVGSEPNPKNDSPLVAGSPCPMSVAWE